MFHAILILLLQQQENITYQTPGKNIQHDITPYEEHCCLKLVQHWNLILHRTFFHVV